MGVVIECPEKYQNKTLGEITGFDEKVKSLKDWASNPVKRCSILLTGPTGTGKTHMAIAAAKLLPDQDVEDPVTEWIYDDTKPEGGYWRRALKRQAKALFKNCVSLMFEVNSGIEDGTGMMSKLDPLINGHYDALILDDFGINKMTDHARQVFYMIIDSRYSRDFPTLITTNLSLAEIYQVDNRISSRITEMCEIKIQTTGKDWRMKNHAGSDK